MRIGSVIIVGTRHLERRSGNILKGGFVSEESLKHHGFMMKLSQKSSFLTSGDIYFMGGDDSFDKTVLVPD
jgi:hypothetical protein